MNLNSAYLAFRRALLASTGKTLADWGPRDPEVLTGLCPRRFPTSRAGQILLSLDERLWEVGRRHYTRTAR